MFHENSFTPNEEQVVEFGRQSANAKGSVTVQSANEPVPEQPSTPVQVSMYIAEKFNAVRQPSGRITLSPHQHYMDYLENGAFNLLTSTKAKEALLPDDSEEASLAAGRLALNFGGITRALETLGDVEVHTDSGYVIQPIFKPALTQLLIRTLFTAYQAKFECQNWLERARLQGKDLSAIKEQRSYRDKVERVTTYQRIALALAISFSWTNPTDVAAAVRREAYTEGRIRASSLNKPVQSNGTPANSADVALEMEMDFAA